MRELELSKVIAMARVRIGQLSLTCTLKLVLISLISGMGAMCSLDVKHGVEFQVLALTPSRIGLVLQYLKDQPT
jgi:hypothetical protein